jgi:hypothetical protein
VQEPPGDYAQVPLEVCCNDKRGDKMPRGRSTFTKRQKEQVRQQKARDKAERRSQKQDQGVRSVSEVDELRLMKEAAEAQAALFRIGTDEAKELSASGAAESDS